MANIYNQTEQKTVEAPGGSGMRQVTLNGPKLTFFTEEAIKSLRANIQFSGYGLKAIAVTSSHPNEGKSFVTYELARSIATLKKRILLVDCDIRNSVLQARLGVTDKLPGLTEFLCGEAEIGDVICKTDNPYLNILFAGSISPNPSELLSGALFARMCDAMKNSFDYLILDTPPVGAVIDGAIIAKRSDGVVLVVESGNTDRKEALRSKRQLEAADARILGVVLNKTGANGSRYGRKDYYKKGYGYGYGHDKAAEQETVKAEEGSRPAKRKKEQA